MQTSSRTETRTRITGTAQVGETLTATPGTIADPDGITPGSGGWFSSATTTLQWIRVDGGSDSDISSATDLTYTLVTADEGKQVKVKVDFMDDDGHDESRTSDAYPAGSTVLPAATEVPSNWSLKPTAVTAGTQFRLLFLSSTKRDNASSTDIADYNTFVQGHAAAGHADIQTYSTGFRAVGCTADTDARDNTYTTYTSTDKGVPIYWLNGAKAADEYEDFYDGSWDDEANDKNESGTNGPNTSLGENHPVTGCDHDGTEAFNANNFSRALGATQVRLGQPNQSDSGDGPLSNTDSRQSLNSLPRLMYGLSAVFQVAAAPGAPTGLTATASGTTQIDLSWTAPGSTGGSAITGYKIEVSPDGTDGWTDQVANTSNTTTTYAHTGLTAGETRHYRVSAINTNGTGDPSNVDSATTATSAPGAPTGLTATASGTTAINLSWTAPGITGGSAITGYKIEVSPDGTSWTAPGSTGGSAITGYKIEVSPDGTDDWTDQVANTSNTTTYAHTGLTAGDTRHYRVSAINANGTGDPSNVDSATTATSAPGAPTGLSTVPMLGGWPMLLMGALMLLIAAWRLRMQ